MLAYKCMMYGVRKYFELKPEWYKTNLNSFLLAHQQSFDGSGLHHREFPNKQTDSTSPRPPENETWLPNKMQLHWGVGEVILAQL